jgi:hypothetical protein
MLGAGIPKPLAGPPSPTGAAEILEGGGIEIPLPAALAEPGVVPEAPLVLPSSGGGGPSIDIETIISPLKTMRPNVRFNTFSSFFPFPILLNSSQSARTRFICLSKAIS